MAIKDMELKGKIINFLGDSITEGVGASMPQKVYWQLIAQKTGAICNGYGISGTRIAKQTVLSPATWDKTDTHFATRVSSMDKNADVVVVFGGTNDYGHGDAAMGNINSIESNTFYGGMNELCNKLITYFPRAKIIFMTPMHRIGEDNDWNSVGIRNVANLSGYVDVIKEVCKKFSFPVIDLYGELGINPNNKIQNELFMVDGVHPNDYGYERIADFVIQKLKML